MGKGILLWLAGVPLSVIILIAIFTTWIERQKPLHMMEGFFFSR